MKEGTDIVMPCLLCYFFLWPLFFSINTDSPLTKFSFRREIERELVYCQHFFFFRLYTFLVRLWQTSIRRLISVQVCALSNGFFCAVASHILFVSCQQHFLIFFFSVLHSVIQRSFTLSVAQCALDRFYHFSRRRFHERIFYLSINFFPKRNILGIKDQRDRGE
jgi:hypothetical protein